MNTKKIVFILLWVIIGVSKVEAEIDVEARLSGSSLVIGDQLNLQIKIDGARQGAVILFPKIEGVSFQQLGPPTSSSQTIIVNGKVSGFSGLIYNIGVGAEKTGDYLITGIKIKYKNKLYPVKMFRVKAIDADQESNMKVIVLASEEEIYLGQPLEIAIKWLLQENVNEYVFRFPMLKLRDKLQMKIVAPSGSGSASDLIVGGYKVPFQKYAENINSESYTIYMAKFQLYPFRAGMLKIPSASVKAAVERGTEVKRDFFGRLIRSPKLKNIFAVSKAIQVRVKSPPQQNQPPGFSGGVGEYRIEISADAGRIKVGDPLELSIRISGKGKLDKIERPLLSEIPQYKKDFTIIENLQPGDIEEDSITFKQIIRPKHQKITEAPPVELIYFNPRSKQYIAVQSNSLPLKVLASKKVELKDIIVHGQGRSDQNSNLTRKQEGIRANRSVEDIVESQTENRAWLLWFVIPPGIYFLCLALVKRQERLKGDKALSRAKSAKIHKNKRLKNAKALITEKRKQFFEELSRALNGYVADNFNLGAGELTAMDVAQLEVEKRLSSSSAAKIIKCLSEFDRLRFTNTEMSVREKEEIFGLVTEAIKELEKEL